MLLDMGIIPQLTDLKKLNFSNLQNLKIKNFPLQSVESVTLFYS